MSSIFLQYVVSSWLREEIELRAEPWRGRNFSTRKKGKRNYAILPTLLTTRLRKAEICNLKVGDLKTYRNQAVIDIIGKGGELQENTVEDRDPPCHKRLPEGYREWDRSGASPFPDTREAWGIPKEGPNPQSGWLPYQVHDKKGHDPEDGPPPRHSAYIRHDPPGKREWSQDCPGNDGPFPYSDNRDVFSQHGRQERRGNSGFAVHGMTLSRRGSALGTSTEMLIFRFRPSIQPFK